MLVVLFALTRIFWINAVLLFGCAACMVMVFAMLSSLVQLNAPNEMRGRVMSIYMVAFRGGMPLGSLAGGWAATFVGAPTVLTINGVLLAIVATWFLFKSHGVREISGQKAKAKSQGQKEPIRRASELSTFPLGARMAVSRMRPSDPALGGRVSMRRGSETARGDRLQVRHGASGAGIVPGRGRGSHVRQSPGWLECWSATDPTRTSRAPGESSSRCCS